MDVRKLACPSCNVTLRVPVNIAAGKAIKCPRCTKDFRIPAGEGQLIAAKTAAAPPRKTKPAPPPADVDDEDEEERPARKKFRKKKKASGNTGLIVGLVLGVIVLIGGGVAGVVIWKRSDKKTEPAVANNSTAPKETRQASGPPVDADAGQNAGANAAAAATPGSRSMDSNPAPASPAGGETQQTAAGRAVFEAQNCTRCHSLGTAGEAGAAGPRKGRGPDLSKVGRDPSHTVAWLMEHVRDPKTHRPNSRMPAYGDKLSEKELKDLATYLSSLK